MNLKNKIIKRLAGTIQNEINDILVKNDLNRSLEVDLENLQDLINLIVINNDENKIKKFIKANYLFKYADNGHLNITNNIILLFEEQDNSDLLLNETNINAVGCILKTSELVGIIIDSFAIE